MAIEIYNFIKLRVKRFVQEHGIDKVCLPTSRWSRYAHENSIMHAYTYQFVHWPVLFGGGSKYVTVDVKIAM